MKRQILSIILCVLCFSTISAKDEQGRIVVSPDGSGDYSTLTEAIRKIRGDFDDPVTIFVKNGVYREKILINATVNNVTVEGENPDSVIISYGDYSGLNNMGTSGSYTVKIEGNNITFRNITFENTAGRVGPAVACHTIGDRIRFFNCRFLGNQDTLYTGGRNGRLYFKDCYVEGTTDFIFGSATALFENCRIHAKADSYITAASTAKETPVGYVFYRCDVTSAPDVTRLYLGRPWRPYASTYFIECSLPSSILPAGWENWGNPDNEKTARYGEYDCSGPGASTAGRVAWERKVSPTEAARLISPSFIYTRTLTWDPEEPAK
ncbi:MAG: pectin esterase [Duncaniella sp.]|nr:pectin esterase [Duncaniella sp.]